MNTKYFAVLFFIASAAAVELIDPTRDIREKCRIQGQLTADALANGVHTPEQIGPFLLCFGHATGVLQSDGTLNKKAVIKVSEKTVPENILIPMADICVEKVVLVGVTDPTQKMLIFSNCLKNVLGGELLRLTGYCQPPTWPRFDTFKMDNGHHHHHHHHHHYAQEE